MTDRYAVMGNPIAHSLSPNIHTLFAKQTQQSLCYETILAPNDAFPEQVKQFFTAGGKGLNITIPFKQQAMQLADRLTERAKRAQAVNTLWQKDNLLWGDNTDGVGITRDIETNHGLKITQKSLLIIGAGGAVRGILESILSLGPAKLVIANRTHEKAQQLAEEFADIGNISACEFNQLPEKTFDIVVNGTATGLSNEKLPLPEKILANNACCYDMVYGKPTPFLEWAKQQNAAYIFDGLGMLVEQAAEAFSIWRGVHPNTTSVINTIRNGLSI